MCQLFSSIHISTRYYLFFPLIKDTIDKELFELELLSPQHNFKTTIMMKNMVNMNTYTYNLIDHIPFFMTLPRDLEIAFRDE
jgi:hypothetical protein